ncbi:DeoR/GlpR family DNA-binding transcription regulator [Gordonia hankookensis]|uniref:DeoR/GlpR transcriptional regulator n=1 Tax=Gordonia hankookensis TaxID=589403 RepID=A0ABR7WEK9_9ACTN|nr:DeoR/GlpR family DNA-binding transcription regulator [Gordonia hankookensis]MBD1321215.1 DeoR/GlpR transcriptional regulator [Gordonia hankookensis]
MLAAERRGHVLAAVVSRGAVRVTDLAAEMGVSEMTIRRDLDHLESDGELSKVHGGAVRTDGDLTGRGLEPPSSLKATREPDAKRAIALAALPLIEDGMTVAIGAGTTTLELARLLRGRDISVVTNSVSIFELLTDPSDSYLDAARVQLTGGQRTPSDALVGPIANAALEHYRTDRAFVGTHGIDPSAGVTTPNLGEAETNRKLLTTARSTVVLADHTKYGEIGAHLFAEFGRINRLVTDDGLPAAARSELADIVVLTIAEGIPR